MSDETDDKLEKAFAELHLEFDRWIRLAAAVVKSSEGEAKMTKPGTPGERPLIHVKQTLHDVGYFTIEFEAGEKPK